MNPRADAVRSNLVGLPIAWVRHPVLWIYAAVLGVMVSLSFEVASLHELAMAIRWPVLSTAALVGVVLWLCDGAPAPAGGWTAIAVLLALASASALLAPDPSYSIQRTGSLVLLFLAMALGLGTYCRSWGRVLAWTDLLWCLGAVLVVAGFVYRLDAAADGRYEGLHDRATGAGTYAALFLPIALFHLRYRLTGAGRLVGFAVVALWVAQLFGSGSRTAIVIAGAVSIALMTQFGSWRSAMVLLVGGWLALMPMVLDRRQVDSAVDRWQRVLRQGSLETFTGRWDRWRFGIEQFARRPVLGHGFGTSRTLASEVEPYRFGLAPGDMFLLHSDQIEVLVDLGLLGYLPFAWFWLCVALATFKLLREPISPRRQLGLAFAGSAAFAFVDTFMHGGFLSAGGGVSAYSWSMLAALFALSTAHQPARAAGRDAADVELSETHRALQPVEADPSASWKQDRPSIRRLAA